MKVKNIILFLVMLFITMWTPINAASLVVNDVTIKSGQKEQLTINMNNSETNLSGFQFILSLPHGVTIDKNEKNKFIYSLGNRISDHTLSITALNDGRYQFICYSMDGDLITGTSGELLSVTITADNSFTTSGNGTLSDIKLTDINAQKTTCSNVGFHITLQVPASSISLDKPSLTFTAKNQTATLTATVLPSNATDKSVTWTSSNTSVATVDANGKVTAVANGTATITAKTNDGSNLTATCKVTVDIPIIATDISLDKPSLTFTAANQTATLTATVLPSNATNKSVTWTSSNTSVATVDANGKVTAVANGTATITAKTNDGSNLSATCTVTVEIPEPFSNNKLYTLTCKRGGLVMNAEGTGLAAGQTRTDAPEADKHFAIVTYNGGYYLYSPTVKQYLLADGSFVSRLGSAITFDDSKADGEYKYMLSTQGTNGETWYFNNNGDIVINGWDAADDGNRWLIEPVADFDPTEALAMASNQTYMVTYEVLYEGKVVATATEEVASGSALPLVPYPLANSFVLLNKIGTHPTTVTKDITVQFTATWNGPFELSKDEATAKWYNMHIHSGWYVGKQNSEPYYPTDNAGDALNTKEYQWAFGGDPYHIKVYNRTTGFAETLSKDGENIVMRSGDYSWDILPNSDGFVLRETGTDYNCINQFGGYGGPLKFWNDGWSPTDDGSTFRVEEAQPIDENGISNWENDVIAENLPAKDFTDETLDIHGWVLFTPEVKANDALQIVNGKLTTNSGTVYTINPDKKNALVLKTANTPKTLNFTTPVKCGTIYFMAISSQGTSTLEAVVNYDDGSKEPARQFSVLDWYSTQSGQGEAIYGFDRIKRITGDGYEADVFNGLPNFRIFEYMLPVNKNKTVVGITFTNTSSAIPSVLGVTTSDETVEMSVVTYEILYDGKVVATATEEVVTGSNLPELPASLKNEYITLTKSGTHPTKVIKDVTVQFTAKWDGPFEFSKNVTNAKWYNMTIRSNYYVGKQESEPYYPTADAGDLLKTKAYHWAFGGDPYHVKVYNRTTDFTETLSKDGENAVMRSGDYTWYLLANNGGFVLRETGTDYNCINQLGGGGGPLGFWNDSQSLTDVGSTFRVEEAQPIDEKILATSISLDQTSLTFTAKNETALLTATVLPDNATNKSVTWTSNKTSVATVDANGKVTAVANGTATITAKTNDGSNLSATCKVTVEIPIIATSISLSKTSLTFTVANQTATLTATVLPSNATNKSVTWTSSNTSVATVDANGKVTAVANGSATITAKTNDGSNLSATCKVTVDIPEPGIFSNNKLYTLTCKRGGLVMNAEGTGLAAGQTRTDAPEVDKHFAIITYNGQYYLYSPTVKQYLLADGSFVSRLGSAITFDDSKADGEYKFMLSTQGTDGVTWYFNNNGDIVICDWSLPDDGNRWLIEPVADFDPSEALAMAAAQSFKVTYEVLYEGKVVATATEEVASGNALLAPPASLKNDYITLSKSGTHPTKVTKDVTVQFTAKWNGPFEFSKNVTNAKWYNMHIRSGWYVGKQEIEPYYPKQNDGKITQTEEYLWAFGGDPYHVKVYNYTTGFAETLTKDGENAVMRQGEYAWDLLSNNGGFVLRETGTDYNCINQLGGGGGLLGFWYDRGSLTDDGSTFRVEEAMDIVDGIESLTPTLSKGEGEIYDLNGRKLSSPQKGINIIRMSDGTSRKVLIR